MKATKYCILYNLYKTYMGPCGKYEIRCKYIGSEVFILSTSTAFCDFISRDYQTTAEKSIC